MTKPIASKKRKKTKKQNKAERDAKAKSRRDIGSANTLPGTSDIPTKKAKVDRAGGLVTSNPSRRRRGSKASDESYILDDDSSLDLVTDLMTNFPETFGGVLLQMEMEKLMCLLDPDRTGFLSSQST